MGPEWALPEGVTMIVMDSPDRVVDVHNAIADAVGEPKATFTYTPMSPPWKSLTLNSSKMFHLPQLTSRGDSDAPGLRLSKTSPRG